MKAIATDNKGIKQCSVWDILQLFRCQVVSQTNISAFPLKLIQRQQKACNVAWIKSNQTTVLSYSILALSKWSINVLFCLCPQCISMGYKAWKAQPLNGCVGPLLALCLAIWQGFLAPSVSDQDFKSM